jgi:HEAT repeat protein
MIQDLLVKLQEGNRPSAVLVGQLSGLASDEAEDFRSSWARVPVERRRAILELAVELAENDVQLEFTTVFRASLADPDPLVRATAIEGLWEDDEFRTADQLARILRQDPAESVRVAAALGLARFAVLAETGKLYAPSASRVRAALLEAVTDPHETPDVRRRSLEALGAFGDPTVGDLIARAYADSDSKLRASAVFAMGRNGDERWLATILHELENPNPELRFEAARAAGELESPRALVPLITRLDDEDVEVRLAVIGALAQIGGDVARKALQRCAKSEDVAIRDAANDALGELDLLTDPLTNSPFLDDSTRTV